MGKRDDILFVAEFTTNHMGNMNLLLKMVEQSEIAGASIIKMQKKDVEVSYSQKKLNMPYQSPYGKTYRDYRSLFEFNYDDFKRFNNKCLEKKIPWFITIQDKESLGGIEPFMDDIPYIKVSSINAKNKSFLQFLKQKTKKTLVVSTGGSDLSDIDYLVSFFDDRDVFILQCTASYPCRDKDLKLGNIIELKRRYSHNQNVSIGYSGHEEGYLPSIVAGILGAEMIERHFCVSRNSFVHHIECSLEPHEFKEMTKTIRSLNVDFDIYKKPDQDIRLYIENILEDLNVEVTNLTELLCSEFGVLESEKMFLFDGRYRGKDFLTT